MKSTLLFAVVFCCVVSIQSLQNGLARTPPMGWLAWERFRCNTNCKDSPKTCVSENLFKDMADRMVDDGFRDAGYEYVNIDDCWSNKTRDSNGKLIPDPDRFPSGMKALADYIHGKGLKLGIYADYGTKTCAGYPGSLDYMEVDANTFAEWGIDMLKMDGCNSNVTTMKTGYPQMGKYLLATGRPILFSCSWPDYERSHGIPIDFKLVAENCNIWRNYIDIDDSWDSITKIIDYEASVQDILFPVVGPGNFSDPDMLIIGDFSLSVNQAQAQMALWAVMAAPMLMSNDLRTITPQFREILLNKEVIAVSQDPAGIMGKRVLQSTIVMYTYEAWTRPLTNATYATAIVNRNLKLPVYFVTTLTQLQVTGHAAYHLVELFTGVPWGIYEVDDEFAVNMKPGGTLLLKATPAV